MIIIWGTRGITSTLGGGSFFCPSCGDEADYHHKQVRPFFTLYFIPIFPTGAAQRYVECVACRNTFYEEVLELDVAAAAPLPALEAGSDDGSTDWRVRDRVLARWSPDGYYYSGVVQACSEGRVGVVFDDGQRATVSADEVCEVDIDVGGVVYARTAHNPNYHAATVENKNGEEYFIRYDDGRTEDSNLGLLRVLR